MINRIRSYIDHEFGDIPQTKKVKELKEELMGNLVEKYNDYLANGNSKEEAYTATISGIGDISELVENMREADRFSQVATSERKKHAAFMSIGVAIYIISVFMIPIFSVVFQQAVIGIFVMFLLIAIATGLIIYSSMIYKDYNRKDDTMVESFKEFRAESNKKKAAYQSFRGAFWSITAVIYLLVSFLYGIWAYSWIIFIIAKAIESIFIGICNLRSDKNE